MGTLPPPNQPTLVLFTPSPFPSSLDLVRFLGMDRHAVIRQADVGVAPLYNSNRTTMTRASKAFVTVDASTIWTNRKGAMLLAILILFWSHRDCDCDSDSGGGSVGGGDKLDKYSCYYYSCYCL